MERGGGKVGGRLQCRAAKGMFCIITFMISLTQTAYSKAQHLQSWFSCTSSHKNKPTQWSLTFKETYHPSAESEKAILIAANKQTLCDHYYYAIKIQKMSLSGLA